MFVFVVTTTLSSSSQRFDAHFPTKYLEFNNVFNKGKASTLSYHHPYDCPINLQPRKEPTWGPIYNVSPSELKALQEYIDEHLGMLLSVFVW